MTIKELEAENKRLRKRVAELEEELENYRAANNTVEEWEWGDEYNEEEIEQLNKFFSSYTSGIPTLNAAQKYRFQDVSRLELRRRQLSAGNDPKESKIIADELKNIYSILGINNLGAKPERSSDERFIDSIIAKIETTEPAVSNNDYKDINGFEAASREIYRCLRNSVCGQREFPDITADPNDPSEELKLQQ